MGESLNSSDFILSLGAVTQYLDNQTVQNRSRLNRIGIELLDAFSSVYKKDIENIDFRLCLEAFIAKESNKTILKIIDEELFYFEKLLPILKGSSFKSALHLFMNRVKNRSLDDVRGGKITVMGVLETRNVSFDGVIVVDFNEGTVPRKSEKDLFLNSATRIKAGLPGASDREALQKLYYNNLFLRAKEVAISYVSSAEALPSRFLMQLGIETHQQFDELDYSQILFQNHTQVLRKEEKIEQDYDFTSRTLSATGLKSFLTCKRRYFHHYIQGLKEHEIELDLPKEHEIGTALHDALRDVYEKKSRFTDKLELRQEIALALEENSSNNVLTKYQHKLWMQQLEPFIDNEIERFKEAEVKACELALSKEVNGIKIGGKIDRIDRTLEGLEVLDYKSGSYPKYNIKSVEKATDFQLEFYYLLAQNEGEVNTCGYYDLKTGEIINEDLLERKLELLKEHLTTLKETKHFDFEKTELLKDCQYCPYTYLCGRDK